MKRLALAALCTALPALGVAADASLHVYGAVQRELRLDLAALRQLPAQDSGKLAMVCQSGAQVGAEREYRGVRLSDVLDQAGLDMPGHQDARRSYVVARSSRDGYAVVFSWGELYNSEAGDDILVAYQKNGLALDPGQAPLALVPTSDL
ncbi:molybdopterin-dependent oxidoreductase, partial [Pseudomonas aeruginosa]|uniref:molybdopterin-dependent oxidoreductase n=1 Tax=Pseudomonas aeruginosa TaxID=287 RepID=UPI0039694053